MQLTVLNGRAAEHQAREQVDSRRLERELRAGVDAEVRFDTASRHVYAMDSSNYRQVPLCVVVPRSVRGVVDAVAACRAAGAPIVSRGAGTALAGQTTNAAVVLDFSKYLNRVLSIDVAGRTATVEPGCHLDDLRDQAKAHGLTFGPDPSTHEYCTLGGMLGNNSCGVHSVMAGRTSDNTEELSVVTYDGVRARVGATGDGEIDRIIARGGRLGEIYAGLREIRDEHADNIRKRYPRIPRRVSGYNLDDLLPENGFHVARALVGTEGTCAVTLGAKLRLIEWPPYQAIVVLGYPDVYTAGDAIPEVMALEPMACEGIDERLVEDMQRTHLHVQDLRVLPEGKGWLIVQFGGHTQKDAHDNTRRAMERLAKTSHRPSMRLVEDSEQEEKIWRVRESGLGATAIVPGRPSAWPGWEDTAVHPERFGDYLRDFDKLLKKHGYEAALYGHFGQGLLHCRITFDLETHEGLENFRAFSQEVSSLVVRYNGSLSGEHGDGQARAEFLEKMYGPELMRAMHKFKLLWDPQWKMNPGKVIDPHSNTQNLRLGQDYQPWNPKTYFKFPEDHGSFAHAALRCVGVGKCRRTHDAFMCPSYQVTREEEQTTRGRARALFEMVRDGPSIGGWKSDAVRRTLDLCLACKGCKHDCPVKVDMATYKAEFFAHYYEGRIRPRSHYSMGLIGLWSRLGMLAPSLANWASRTRPFSDGVRLAGGISRERPMPLFARQRFTDWFRRRSAPVNHGATVLLYPDLFNDCFFPGTLKAMALVLERLGHRVAIPEERVAAIRPLIHYGFLPAAIRELRRTVRMLAPYARAGVPIVCAEPSVISVFRDDLPNLMPGDGDGNRIQKHFRTLPEFLMERTGRDALPHLAGDAVLHIHCHEKALLKPDCQRELLKSLGLKVHEPDPGCCGLAGAFGFEAEHHEVSMRIGEQRLLPAVRASKPYSLVIADGFSCRKQILDGTGRMPLHTAEVLHMALSGDNAAAAEEHPVASTAAVALGALGAAAGIGALVWALRRASAAR